MKNLIIEEYRSTGTTRHHIDSPEHFLKIVDKVRAKNVGWQLKLNGEIVTEQQAFGKTVCYGMKNSSSFFNE